MNVSNEGVGRRRALAIGGDRGSADGSGRKPQSLLSSSRVGSANRGFVIQALFDLGPTSRAELARVAGVNRTTISGIVQPLIDDDFLVETSPLSAGRVGGKPARPLWFSPRARPICGVLLMPGAVHSCIVSLDGVIETEQSVPLPPGDGPREAILAAIGECIRATVDAAPRKPRGIGVAVGGMVDTDRGTIVAINLAPSLSGYPLADDLARRFQLPVKLDHHPRALLVGDRWFGKGRALRQFAAVYTGEVLGGALYLDGHLLRGAAGAGGELGHTFVQVDGARCCCGQRGCWDTIATLRWVRGEAETTGLPGAAQMNAVRLLELSDAGSADASALLDRYARNIAIGIANLQQTLAPDFYILHGDVASAGARMLSAIEAHVLAMVPARPGSSIRIVAGEAGDRPALLGAAGLILSEMLQFSI